MVSAGPSSNEAELPCTRMSASLQVRHPSPVAGVSRFCVLCVLSLVFLAVP